MNIPQNIKKVAFSLLGVFLVYEISLADKFQEIDNATSDVWSIVIPKHKRIKWCTGTLKRISDDYLNLKKNLLSQNSQDLDVLGRLRDLEPVQQKYFDEINQYIDEFGEKVNGASAEQLTEMIKNLVFQKGPLIDRLTMLEMSENHLMQAVSHITNTLHGFLKREQNNIITILSKDCDEEHVVPLYEFIEQDVGATTKLFGDVHSFILAGKRKRHQLLAIVSTTLRLHLEAKYRKLTISAITELQAELNATVLAAEIGERFYQWDNYIARRGVGDGLDSPHFQFERPLRLMRVRMQKTKSFEDELLALPNRPITSNIILNNIKRLKKLIQLSIDRMIRNGWEGQLGNQRDFMQYRLDSPHLFSQSCLAAFSDFLGRSTDVRTLETFRKFESEYYHVSTTCDQGPDVTLEEHR